MKELVKKALLIKETKGVEAYNAFFKQCLEKANSSIEFSKEWSEEKREQVRQKKIS